MHVVKNYITAQYSVRFKVNRCRMAVKPKIKTIIDPLVKSHISGQIVIIIISVHSLSAYTRHRTYLIIIINKIYYLCRLTSNIFPALYAVYNSGERRLTFFLTEGLKKILNSYVVIVWQHATRYFSLRRTFTILTFSFKLTEYYILLIMLFIFKRCTYNNRAVTHGRLWLTT